MLVTLALTFTTSAALTLSLTRNTSLALLTPTNITSSALEQPAAIENTRPWPTLPYYIRLGGIDYIGVVMCISTIKPLRNLPMIDVHDLQLFLRDFADQLRQEYPVPGFIPRESRQFNVDVPSNTKWMIWLKEVFYGRVPTQVALAALDTLEKEMGKYEMAEIGYGVFQVGSRGPWSVGGIYHEKIMGASFNDSLSNENDSLQTA